MRWLLVFILLLCVVHADSEVLYGAQKVLISHSIFTSVDISYNGARLTTLEADLQYIPTDSYRQTVQRLTTDPQPKSVTDGFIYSWQDPDQSNYDFRLDSQVEVFNVIPNVDRKVAFPFSVPSEYEIYTQEAANIDITPEIRAKAFELAGDSDDAYEIVHRLANWVEQNIEYSLSTVTAEAALPASWVFEQRKGVCDELTLLFIAMLRSLDIPAKFVSGMSYTDSDLFDEKWNAHAWAEVYLPQVGWIPVDVTYRQFGMIDAGHLKLREAADGNSSYTHYSWTGYNLDRININLNELEFDTNIVGATGSLEYPVDFSVELMSNNMGFDSYNRARVVLRNKANTYLSVPLSFITSQEVDVEQSTNNVLLFPGETKVVDFVFYVPALDNNLRYRVPVQIYTPWKQIEQLWVGVDRSQNVYSRESVSNDPPPVENLPISWFCDGPDTILEGQNARLRCTVLNEGEPTNVELCLEAQCISQAVEEKYVFALDYEPEQTGRLNLAVTVNGRPSNYILDVQRPPTIDIQVEKDYVISWGEDFDVLIDLSVTGTAHDVNIKLTNGVSPLQWELEKLDGNQPLRASLSSWYVWAGENELPITITYADVNGERYEQSNVVNVTLENVSWWQAIWLRILHGMQGI